jgi:hypothetical protein
MGAVKEDIWTVVCLPWRHSMGYFMRELDSSIRSKSRIPRPNARQAKSIAILASKAFQVLFEMGMAEPNKHFIASKAVRLFALPIRVEMLESHQLSD